MDLSLNENGVWETTLLLSSGRYTYKIIANENEKNMAIISQSDLYIYK